MVRMTQRWPQRLQTSCKAAKRCFGVMPTAYHPHMMKMQYHLRPRLAASAAMPMRRISRIRSGERAAKPLGLVVGVPPPLRPILAAARLRARGVNGFFLVPIAERDLHGEVPFCCENRR